MSKSSKSRVSRRGIILLTGFIVSLVTFVIGANVALAHHSEITATIDCAKTVSWTATAWTGPDATPERRTNNSVKVWYQVAGSDTKVDVPGGLGAFNAGNNYSFTGTFPFPSNPTPASITVFVQEQVGWGPNQDLAGIDAPRSVTVSPPGDCPGSPSADAALECVNGDGQVTVTLATTGGDQALTFAVTPQGGALENIPVAPGQTATRTYSGIADGQYSVTITVGEQDLSKSFTVACDRPGTPSANATLKCVEGSGLITVTLTATGGELPIVFSIAVGNTSEDVSVPAGQTISKNYAGLADGPYTVTVTVAQNVVYTNNFVVGCARHFTIVAVCNEVDVQGTITEYWFKITNNDDTALDVMWEDGSATVPANGNVMIKSANKSIVLFSADERRIGEASANDDTCGTQVRFEKKLQGQPPSGETYTIRVSRLVGQNYVQELTFPINAGEPKTFVLPSTFDPEGITYKIEEVNAGTSVTHAVSPDSFVLKGNLGETVSVVITNGYAAVQIDKSVSAQKVKGGDTLTYTLVATNTGGLTLNPVVISDLFPAQLSVVSAEVAGGKGDCTLTRTSRPQLLECTMDDALAPDTSTPAITIKALLDADAPVNATLLNQAKVLGTYVTAAATTAVEGASLRVESLNLRTEAEEELSCLPVISGTVCDLSAKVGFLVDRPDQSEPPTTAPPPSSVSPVVSPPVLPVTGGRGLGNVVLIGFAFVTSGAVILMARRRRTRLG